MLATLYASSKIESQQNIAENAPHAHDEYMRCDSSYSLRTMELINSAEEIEIAFASNQQCGYRLPKLSEPCSNLNRQIRLT